MGSDVIKPARAIPIPLFVGVIVLLVLLFGGYFLGTTQAVSTQRVYITDPSGTNGVSVNAAGHMSVHIADNGLPAFAGPLGTRQISFPPRAGVSKGECYAAYIRGGGSFLSASVTLRPGMPAGQPRMLVRLDQNPVWLEAGTSDSTPLSPSLGVTHSGAVYVFGYSYSLSFKAFAGVLLCWGRPGRSDGFAVQMTIANNAGSPYLPEEMRFQMHGNTYTWSHLQGPRPEAYQLMDTDSTLVSYYKPLGVALPFVSHQRLYSTKISSTPRLRFYVFELQPGGSSPTRVGPFGNWTGE